MKQGVFVISYIGLIGIIWVVNACNSESSSIANSISTDSLTIAKGQASFFNNCSGCHNFKHNGIGPQLGGVTADTTVDWIKSFIHDPKTIIESGDTRAQRQVRRFKTIMPSFSHLPDGEIDAIIAYMHTQKKRVRTKVEEDTNDIRNPIPDSIENSGVVVNLELVTQIPASADQPPLTRITKLDYEPTSGDVFIVDIRGKLYKLVDGKPAVYLDMYRLKSKLITGPGIATGFGSFAFHPGFTKNGLLYTTHAEPAGTATADFNYPDSIPVALQWVLSEWKTDAGVFPFSGQSRELFRIDMPTTIHGMQEIAFNRGAKTGDEDYGLLYVGIGDGGSAQIGPSLVSRFPEKAWGSIIRIDPSGTNSRNGKYGIPSTNPFSNNDPEKFVREIYGYGFRNPHRFSWTNSGQLLAVNIGEHHIESVNMILPGHFYGWPIREGKFQERFFNEHGRIYELPSDDSVYNITYPVAQFDHDEGIAITGGYEYNNAAIPALKGKYLFADLDKGRLFFVNSKDLQIGKQATVKEWNIRMNGEKTTLTKLVGNRRVEMRFGRDKKGDIYILTKRDGKVYKLVK